MPGEHSGTQVQQTPGEHSGAQVGSTSRWFQTAGGDLFELVNNVATGYYWHNGQYLFSPSLKSATPSTTSPGLLNAAPSPSDLAAAGGGSRGAVGSAATMHRFLVSLLLMLAFVVVMTMIAGTSQTAGRAVVLFFLLLLLLQGIAHAAPFGQWVANHPLTPQ